MASTKLANAINAKYLSNSMKSVTQLPPLDQKNSQVDSLDLKKVLVITKNDLDRITSHLNKRQKEEENLVEEFNRKKELHEKSQALTSKWNNTIDGARKKKLEQKKIKEENEEQEKRQVDLEHAKFMAEERRKQLEQAKLLQYYETDKVKALHSGLRLTEVLKERDAQLEMKKILENSKKNQEAEESKQILNDYNAFFHSQIEESAKKQKERIKLSEYHKAQIFDNIEKKRKEKEEEELEAEALKELNDQYRYEKAQLDEIEKQRRIELKQSYAKTIEIKKKMIEAERLMDEDENDEIRAYAAAKRKIANMKRAKEYEIWKQKQEKREKIIAYLSGLLKQQEDDEGFRIAKAIEQSDKRREQEELKKMKERKEAYDAIRKHREQTIREKKHQKELKLQETQEFMKSNLEADYLYRIYEDEKHKQKIKKLQEIANENFKELQQRKLTEKVIRQEEKDFIEQESRLLEMEDKQFEDYANRVIDYMEKHGRNVYPMRKVLNDHLRSIRKLESSSEASLIKKHQNDIPTSKNLGFVAVKPKVNQENRTKE